MVEIKPLDASEILSRVDELAAILHECVQGGASVSFMSDFNLNDARTFFCGVSESVRNGERALLAALQEGRLVGSVQLILSFPPNQPHRAEIAKVIVANRARRQGIATQLMAEAEAHALRLGKTHLMLDTVTGSVAEALYVSLGWQKVGCVPGFAYDPAGELCSTTYFYKQL